MADRFVRPPRQRVRAGSACRPPKGPGELAIAPLGPLGSPLPFPTRSRGSVLRRIRSCQASFWWSEGDEAPPTEPRDWQLTTASGEAWVKRNKALS